MYNGAFVSFEGIDGCGKTEQAFRLGHWLFSTTKKFTSLLTTREPTASASGLKLRQLLRTEKDPFSKAEQFLQLYVDDRRGHWENEIKPALEAGEVVVCDRFKHSSCAFQQTQGIALERILELHEGIPSPELILLIDVPADEAFRRMSSRGVQGNEKFEQLEFMKLLRETYLRLPQQMPADRVVVVDGVGSREQVFERVKQAALASKVLDKFL